MPGLDCFLWGGPAALVVAAAAFALALRATRRGAVAWHVGVISGLAAGALAMDAHAEGFAAACNRLARPIEAHGRLPLIALAAAAPALLAAATRRSWTAWLLAVPLAALAPLWLLWGGRYLPKQEVRDAGFAEAAWAPTTAVLVLTAIAAATLVVWSLWRRAEPTSQPLLRSVLAAAAIGGAGATVAFTGSITYGQTLALLAIAVAACGAVAWLLKSSTGPDAAAGPIVFTAASLLALGVCYSDLKLSQAVSLAVLIALSAGSLPLTPRSPRVAAGLRAALVIVPLAIIAGQAAARLEASQRPSEEPDSEASLYSAN